LFRTLASSCCGLATDAETTDKKMRILWKAKI
jgi:hypothetical protein